MNKNYLFGSIGLHITVFLVLILDLPFFGRPRMVEGQAPIIVDLKDVRLAEMTNLPPRAVAGKEDKKASAPEKKPAKKWTTEENRVQKLPPAPKETKAEAPKRDFLEAAPAVPEKKPAPKPRPKPIPKPAAKPVPKPVPAAKPEIKDKTPPVKKRPAKKSAEVKTIANPLKSLMDTVRSMEKDVGKEAPATIKEGTPVANMGIEGGTGGSYFSELTISETDAIAGRLRECWNLDPGARGIENMVIEIRAYLNRDGSVRDVQILDRSRYNSDPHFRAIAESARRAVYTCSYKNNVNIYKVFSEKYADKYNLWNTLLLRFNPMDATVK